MEIKLVILVFLVMKLSTTVDGACQYTAGIDSSVSGSTINCQLDEQAEVGTTACTFSVVGQATVTLQNYDQPYITSYLTVTSLSNGPNTDVTLSVASSCDGVADTRSYLMGRLSCTQNGNIDQAEYLTVTFNLINDHEPVITSNLNSVTVPEIFSSSVDILAMSAANITASDGDTPDTAASKVDFSLEDDFGGIFSVATVSSGSLYQMELYTVKNLDYAKNPYILTIIAQDEGSPVNTATMTLTVNVQDVDNLDPAFEQMFYNGDVQQLNVGTQTVNLNPSIKAADQDTGIDAKISYSLVASNTGSCDDETCQAITAGFHVDPLNGELTVNTNIDFSAIKGGVASFLVLATQDDDPRHYGTAFVSITLPSSPSTTTTTTETTTACPTESTTPTTIIIPTSCPTITPDATTPCECPATETITCPTITTDTTTSCECPACPTTDVTTACPTATTDSTVSCTCPETPPSTCTTVPDNTGSPSTDNSDTTGTSDDSGSTCPPPPTCPEPTCPPLPPSCTTIPDTPPNPTGTTAITTDHTPTTTQYITTLVPLPANNFYVTLKNLDSGVPMNTVVLQMQEEGSTYRYTLTDNSDRDTSYFDIDPNTGDIFVTKTLESRRSPYHLRVHATSLTTLNTDVASVTVDVKDDVCPNVPATTPTSDPDCDNTVYIAVIAVLSALLGICLIAFGITLWKLNKSKSFSALRTSRPPYLPTSSSAYTTPPRSGLGSTSVSSNGLDYGSVENGSVASIEFGKKKNGNISSSAYHSDSSDLTVVATSADSEKNQLNQALSTEWCDPLKHSDEPVLDNDTADLLSGVIDKGATYPGLDNLQKDDILETASEHRYDEISSEHNFIDIGAPDPDPDYVHITKSILVDPTASKGSDGDDKSNYAVQFDDTPEVIAVEPSTSL